MRVRWILRRLSIASVVCLVSAAAWAQDGTVQNFALGRFTFESGAAIDNAHVTYVTWGRLKSL